MTKWKKGKVCCPLGLFGVFLPLIYGEGEANAAQRFQEEIEKRQKGQGTEILRDIGYNTDPSDTVFGASALLTKTRDCTFEHDLNPKPAT
jgi:hypothetical protein